MSKSVNKQIYNFPVPQLLRPTKNSCASCCHPSLKKPASLKFLLDF